MQPKQRKIVLYSRKSSINETRKTQIWHWDPKKNVDVQYQRGRKMVKSAVRKFYGVIGKDWIKTMDMKSLATATVQEVHKKIVKSNDGMMFLSWKSEKRLQDKFNLGVHLIREAQRMYQAQHPGSTPDSEDQKNPTKPATSFSTPSQDYPSPCSTEGEYDQFWPSAFSEEYDYSRRNSSASSQVHLDSKKNIDVHFQQGRKLVKKAVSKFYGVIGKEWINTMDMKSLATATTEEVHEKIVLSCNRMEVWNWESEKRLQSQFERGVCIIRDAIKMDFEIENEEAERMYQARHPSPTSDSEYQEDSSNPSTRSSTPSSDGTCSSRPSSSASSHP